MKALVIYDSTGKIYLIQYGATNVPQGIPSMWVDIPDGAALDRMDVTDVSNPKPVFTYLPESDIGRLQIKVEQLSRQMEQQDELSVDMDYRLSCMELGL